MSEILRFPDGFLWGSATSSYQVEGGINNCDWSKDFPAGLACDHYNRYEEDFDLIKKLNQNAYRFSIEWSRIEPEEGKFDEKEIEHYRKVLLVLKERDIKSFVTLWHWTTPVWLVEKGGWSNKKIIDYFTRYVKVITKELGDLIDFWTILNEPMDYLAMRYVTGDFPPRKRNIFLFVPAFKNLIQTHKKAYKAIHEFKKEAQVSSNIDCSFVEPYNKKSPPDRLLVLVWRYLHNFLFSDFTKQYQDYLGIDYYFHDRLNFRLGNPFSSWTFLRNANKVVSDLGWEVYPEGIYHVLKELYQRYQKPIYITENGLADKEDKFRKDFIKDHLFWTHKAMEEGIDVRGYFHWSLMDNLEWHRGFEPEFGLIGIDYKTLERKPRPSAYYYGEICKNNSLTI